MNDVPIITRSGWQVQTTDKIISGAAISMEGVWFWSAWGPRGHQSGAENSPHAAAAKARAASQVLADTQELKEG